MFKKEIDEAIEKDDKLFELQRKIALEDVKAFVREYLALRTGAPHYATHGVILNPKELKTIREFADMLVDIVND